VMAGQNPHRSFGNVAGILKTNTIARKQADASDEKAHRE
jgi:hypothetical protein